MERALFQYRCRLHWTKSIIRSAIVLYFDWILFVLVSLIHLFFLKWKTSSLPPSLPSLPPPPPSLSLSLPLSLMPHLSLFSKILFSSTPLSPPDPPPPLLPLKNSFSFFFASFLIMEVVINVPLPFLKLYSSRTILSVSSHSQLTFNTTHLH